VPGNPFRAVNTLIALMIDGEVRTRAQDVLAADDRGLQYGDGVFETALLKDGRLRFFDDHLGRLEEGCQRLGILYPGHALLEHEAHALTAGHRDGVLKLMVTRGRGTRGYKPPEPAVPTRLLQLHAGPMPAPAAVQAAAHDILPCTLQPIHIRWCTTRLGRNPALAGIKHLNRLEQVLARREWDDDGIADGLMLDSEGEVICATTANLFVVLDGVLCTPDLRHCGVRGIMRAHVLDCAARLRFATAEKALSPGEVRHATEIFLTNAIQGIRPVRSLGGLLGAASWTKWSVASTLGAALGL
jgi:4-amino-4-deoxychorismate lyase